MVRIVVLSATLAMTLVAQPRLAFEVASIKPAPPPTGGLNLPLTKIDNARADFHGVSLWELVIRAYQVRGIQVSGPDWMSTTKFDIQAKLPDGATASQAPEMLQTLLAERFKLTLHREAKDFPVYDLVIGKDGSKMTPKPADYTPAPKSDLKPMKMEELTTLLATTVARPVIDKTELKGEFLLDQVALLKLAMQQSRERLRASRPDNGAADNGASDPTGNDVFVMVQSLGLKLESRKMPMPLLVIDHIEKTPTEN